jgi:plasmid stability protein
MAQLLVRNLDNETKERLRKRAALNGHSMEAEARLILEIELAKPVIEEGLGTQIARIMEGSRMDFELPRDEPDIPFEFPDE